MNDRLIKAAMLRTKSGIDFIAFFDFDNLVRDQKAAQAFLMSIRLLTPIPAVLVYRISGELRYFGKLVNDEMINHVRTLSDIEKAALKVATPSLGIQTTGPASE